MRKFKPFFVAAAASILVTGCGGGDGGGVVGSTPTPPSTPTSPTPPAPPTNTLITDLKASQDFTNDATTTNVSFNLTSKTTISGRAAPEALTVHYDVVTNSYTVSSTAFSETFTVIDVQTGTVAGETRYRHGSGGTTSYLTLVTTPYNSGSTTRVSNKYVGMGYLQRNTVTGDRQDTGFSTFAYGLETAAAGVPRSGTGTFAIDVFGLASFPGSEPNVFQGLGRFDVDFNAGLFSTSTGLKVTGLVSGSARTGGGIDLTGGGRLSSSDGRFSGDVVYGDGATARLGGLLSGRFYGPNADEIGASFAGAAADGSSFNGSFTGQRNSTLPAVNISFATLTTPQMFFGDATTLTAKLFNTGTGPQVTDYPGILGNGVSRAQFTDRTSNNVGFGAPNSNLPSGDYTVTSIVTGDPNFTTYQKTIAGQPTKLEMYKTGSANSQLALTYASFGKYSTSGSTDPFVASENNRVFFAYGFATTGGLFNNRTGSATYTGVAYGAAATPTGTIYDVAGTSQVNVDFAAMRLSGALALKTTSLPTQIDYGSFSFVGTVYPYESQGIADIANTGGSGRVLLNFYGPGAEEVAGPFRLKIPDGVNAGTLINGVMAGKRP